MTALVALACDRRQPSFLVRLGMQTVVSPDPSDPKLAHLDGLNLSRAWMLEGIAAGLAEDRQAAAAYHGESSRNGTIRQSRAKGSRCIGCKRGTRSEGVPLQVVIRP